MDRSSCFSEIEIWFGDRTGSTKVGHPLHIRLDYQKMIFETDSCSLVVWSMGENDGLVSIPVYRTCSIPSKDSRVFDEKTYVPNWVINLIS